MNPEDVKVQIEGRLAFLEGVETQVPDVENSIKVLKWVLSLFNYHSFPVKVSKRKKSNAAD